MYLTVCFLFVLSILCSFFFAFYLLLDWMHIMFLFQFFISYQLHLFVQYLQYILQFTVYLKKFITVHLQIILQCFPQTFPPPVQENCILSLLLLFAIVLPLDMLYTQQYIIIIFAFKYYRQVRNLKIKFIHIFTISNAPHSFLQIQIFTWHYFPSIEGYPLTHAGILVILSFRLCVSEKVFIALSFLREVFSRCKILAGPLFC